MHHRRESRAGTLQAGGVDGSRLRLAAWGPRRLEQTLSVLMGSSAEASGNFKFE